ncbi:MAG: type II toxin-antitoxin system RelE/ParE family toxin [Pseudomonadota bacterium]
MKYEVVITPTAEANLSEIHRHIALGSSVAARKFLAGLRNKIKTLATMPERCPLAPEDGLDGVTIRHLIYGDYRILFSIDAAQVVILQVRHGARML